MKNKPRYIDFKQVKNTVSMEQVLDRYGFLESLTRKGDALSGKNPFDSESTNPTRFRVSLSKNCWNVFGSELGGNVLDFVATMEGCDIKSAAAKLESWFSVESGKGTVKKSKPITSKPPIQSEDAVTAVNMPLGFELKHLNPDHEYLVARGLTPECIEHFGLGYCEKGIMGGRIAIPIRNAKAELVGYIGRWPGEPPEGEARYKLPKGFQKSIEIFNIHAAGDSQKEFPALILVEGVFDCMRLWQLGYSCAAAVMGSDVSDAQAGLLRETWDGKILILFDQDEAGSEGAKKAMMKLGRSHWVRIGKLPDEISQPDQLNEESLQQLIQGNDLHNP